MARRSGWATSLAQGAGASAPHEVLSVTVFGAGYVGLVSAACLADLGHYVVCMDTDALRVARLMQGEVPIHEPGLSTLLARNMRVGRLRFTTRPDEAVAHGRVLFIAVGTPSDEDGSADLQHVLAVARCIGERLDGEALVVNKSTVPVGTADRVRHTVQAALAQRGQAWAVQVVSNPEFLKEGSAVADFMHPDRIVVGVDDEAAAALMRSLYAPLVRRPEQWVQMDVRSAELTKYACNAMLASRLSFMNELALLAERLDADIEQVRRGMGGDPRIGQHFLAAGCGYGGSCLPKDVQALRRSAEAVGQPLRVLAAVEQVNDLQKGLLAQRVIEHFGAALEGRRIALWGLAFKPGTDDLREAPSLTVIRALSARGAELVAYDPVAMPAAKWRLLDVPGLHFAASAGAALDDADALVIVTEWPQFRRVEAQELRRRMRTPLVFDGRNVLDPARLAEQGVVVRGLGRRARATVAPLVPIHVDAARALPVPLFPPARVVELPAAEPQPARGMVPLHASGFAGAG